MAKAGKLLIVDDNRSILSAVKLLCEGVFEEIVTLPSPNALITTLHKELPNVVLLDMNFHAGINTGNEGLFWLKEVLSKFPDTKVVLFTAYADIDLAVRAMKEGAYDFVVKPWDNKKKKKPRFLDRGFLIIATVFFLLCFFLFPVRNFY